MNKKQPNILWICTDQQRFDTLGCYGNPYVETPNLDRLARGGVRFEHAYCQNPVCTPSRASFLTGRYPRTTRVRQNGQSIPPHEVPVTKLLSDAGYVCGLSGKLHLSTVYPSVSPGTERRIDDGYDEFHWMHHPWPDWPTNEYQEWLREKGVRYSDKPYENSPLVRTGMPEHLHPTTWCAQKAINFIERCAEFGHPWLFSVNIFDPHHIFDPPAQYLQRYLDMLDDIPLPNYTEGELDNKPPFQMADHHVEYGGMRHEDMTDADHRLNRAGYWAMCDLIDTQVGRMLKALDRTGQLDNTIVIFMSDHGEMLGDHGIYYKGPYLYDSAIRVPLIISMPSVIDVDVCSSALVELVDVAPTLMETVGLPCHPGMQGRSLWPLLTGRAESDEYREDVYCESYRAADSGREPGDYLTMVRTRTHKLTVAHGLDTGELYDLEADPGETYNLWDSVEHRDLRFTMLARLADRMAFTVDPLPLRTGAW